MSVVYESKSDDECGEWNVLVLGLGNFLWKWKFKNALFTQLKSVLYVQV